MRVFLSILAGLIGISTAWAVTIQMTGQEKYGFKQPIYQMDYMNRGMCDQCMVIKILAEDNFFPFSSSYRGSVFYKIFDDLEKRTKVRLDYIIYGKQKYTENVLAFERGLSNEIDGLFAVYYKEWPLSKNKYIYPALMTNNIHIITSVQKKLNVTGKESLKNYKGIHVMTDLVSDMVAKDFKNLGIDEVTDYQTAYETLLTGKADYIVGSYFISTIEAYKLGIKKYIAFSQEPIWKMPMFIRVKPKYLSYPQMETLTTYLKSERYKKMRNEAFNELLEMYKKSTNGIVPPTYIKAVNEEDNSEDTPENTEQ